MNRRERVLAALNHCEPDRTPVDIDGYRSSGIAALAYVKLRKYLGLPEKTVYVYDPIQQLARVDEDVLERLGGDTVEMGRGFPLGESAWADWELPDGTPCKIPAWARPNVKTGIGYCAREAEESSGACLKAGFISARSTSRLPTSVTWRIFKARWQNRCGRAYQSLPVHWPKGLRVSRS